MRLVDGESLISSAFLKFATHSLNAATSIQHPSSKGVKPCCAVLFLVDRL
jgi:hypothetical protein